MHAIVDTAMDGRSRTRIFFKTVEQLIDGGECGELGVFDEETELGPFEKDWG